jgi:AraC family transcriptional activator FtrA
VLTSAGVAAGLDLCLHVIRSDHGAAVASAIARWTVIAPHRDGGQAQFVSRPLTDPDPMLGSLEPLRTWALGRLENSDLTIEQLAQRTGFGTAATLRAHFARRLSTTPTAYRRTFRGSPQPPRGRRARPPVYSEANEQLVTARPPYAQEQPSRRRRRSL